MEKRGHFPIYYIKLVLFWCQNQTRIIKKGKRHVTLMNARILNKMLANRIQQYTERLSGIYSKDGKLSQYSKGNTLIG